MSRKWLIMLAIVASVSVVSVLLWRNHEKQANAAKLEAEMLKGLTVEEIDLIVQSQLTTDPETVATMKNSPDARQIFLKRLRENFALAAEARREGLAEDPNFKVNLEYKKNYLLQTLYPPRLDKEQLRAILTPEAIESVWGNAENESQFSRHIEAVRAAQKVYTDSRETELLAPQLEGEKLKRARRDWAITKILSDKAKADADFIGQPSVALRLRILEAGILAGDYTNKHWRDKIKANDEEIKAYLASHPEFDLTKKRQRAESILLRAKAGEDFGKLAAEFSEDRSTKEKGGLYENIGKDVVWAEVESRALSLEKGQVADTVIESQNGFHIVRLENKQVKTEKDGSQSVKFSLRHIMLQKAFEEPHSRPGIPPPFMKPEEIAKSQVEKEKYEIVVAGLVKRNQISLPEDFVVNLPEHIEKTASEN